MTHPLITAAAAATLNEARNVLRDAVARSHDKQDANLYRLGQVAGIMAQAERALFDVLNWTQVFGLGNYSDDVVQNRTPAERATDRLP